MDLTTVEFALVALAGAAVGLISGIFGIGGGFLIVPVLNICLGIKMELAVGAGVCQVLGPATTSLLARRVGLEHARLPLTIAGGLLVGVVCGAQLLHFAKDQGTLALPARSIPIADLVVLTTYLLLLTSVGTFALREARSTASSALRRGIIADWKVPPCTTFVEFDDTRVSIPVLAWFGLGVGFLSGLLGMSGGMVLLPGLIYLLGIKTQQSVISSLVIVWIIALQATLTHAWQGFVDLWLVMALLLGGTIGARVGSELGTRLAGRELRKRFSWLLLGTALLIAVRLAALFVP